MDTRNIEVVLDDLENNPYCFHGPTLLFKKCKGKMKAYYACSACRDHKDCNFYVLASEKNSKKYSKEFWKKQQEEVIALTNTLNQRSLKIINSIKGNSGFSREEKIKSKNTDKKNSELKANYCYTCHFLFDGSEINKHSNCKVLSNLTYYQLIHPTEVIAPKTNTKTHAQYFFSKSSIDDIVLLLKQLNISKILCIGVPKIHECITSDSSSKIESLLLDLDRSYYNFYSKSKFIWFNMFNNYIFEEGQIQILLNFLKSGEILMLVDPPFGGRVEPLARTLNILYETFRNVRNKNSSSSLSTFWFFPYFMEQHIIDSLPNFKMFDYKVNYENHTSFTNCGNRKRKFGSPVRIFTDVALPRLDLTGVSGYKFCKFCSYWVSNENKHCGECNACTSKNGQTYRHCSKCSKCVKPSYEHCNTCSRCCLSSHICGKFQPDPNCYHCHQPGHKKNECLLLNKRKNNISEKNVPRKKKKLARS